MAKKIQCSTWVTTPELKKPEKTPVAFLDRMFFICNSTKETLFPGSSQVVHWENNRDNERINPISTEVNSDGMLLFRYAIFLSIPRQPIVFTPKTNTSPYSEWKEYYMFSIVKESHRSRPKYELHQKRFWQYLQRVSMSKRKSTNKADCSDFPLGEAVHMFSSVGLSLIRHPFPIRKSKLSHLLSEQPNDDSRQQPQQLPLSIQFLKKIPSSRRYFKGTRRGKNCWTWFRKSPRPNWPVCTIMTENPPDQEKKTMITKTTCENSTSLVDANRMRSSACYLNCRDERYRKRLERITGRMAVIEMTQA